ncbi:rCG32910, isoform CRA_a [Rattus norvegicus]|uniref:RCG32910, isoform CRA_a n=1 Tax=Rattus norvegicus TaxID=10116 RepID=A6HD71_RAT|nr:rCG32910, isoform CRA_a [Rattus norvegicus]
MPAAGAADRATHARAALCTASGTLAPCKSGAKACVQSSEWPEAPHHLPIPRGDPRDLHSGPRGERPICVRSLAAGRATAGWLPCR